MKWQRHLTRVKLTPQGFAALQALQDRTGNSAQTIFDTLLPIVAFEPATVDLSKYDLDILADGCTEKTLILVTTAHVTMFESLQRRYDFGVWQTVNFVLQRGVELFDSIPLPEITDQTDVVMV